MDANLRPPTFLQTRPATAQVRRAPFAGAAGVPRPAKAIAPAAPPSALVRMDVDEPPPGPSAEDIARCRAEAMQQVAHAVEILKLQADRLAEQTRADALEIGFQVARRILEAELSTSPEALFALVRGALKKAGDSRKVAVRLHPADAKLVAAAVAGGQVELAAATIEVVPDAALEAGDCVVDTDFGKVDGRLRTRLDEVRRTVEAAVEEGAA